MVLTLVGALIGVTALLTWLAAVVWGPFGLRGEYQARVARHLAELGAPSLLDEAELTTLPPAVRTYLQRVGVVGQPRALCFRARFRGRIRSGPSAPWMAFRGEQHDFLGGPTRLFFMQASMYGLPVLGLHVYDDQAASMRVKLLGLLSVAQAEGTEFTRAETVTLLNDLCIMAPAGLVDERIRWREIDARQVEATFRVGTHTIRAVLQFADSGELMNFWSDDRPALAPDGVSFLPQRWSTPVGDYRAQGAFLLASRGEGRYAAREGEYTYIEFDELHISYVSGAR